MAMACDAVCARARRALMPDATNSALRRTARRDARQCITAEEPKIGAGEGRMRFVPVLLEFIIGYGLRPGSHFPGVRGFIAGPISAIRQPSRVTLPPYFTRREPLVRRRSGAVGPGREEQGIIAMNYWTASAWPRGRALTATLAGLLGAALVAGPIPSRSRSRTRRRLAARRIFRSFSTPRPSRSSNGR